MRYDAQSLLAEPGEGFRLLEARRERHLTPWRSGQPFRYFRLRYAVEATPEKRP